MFDPNDGQLDLSYFLENPRGFLPIPIVVTFGASCQFRRRARPSSPGTTAVYLVVGNAWFRP